MELVSRSRTIRLFERCSRAVGRACDTNVPCLHRRNSPIQRKGPHCKPLGRQEDRTNGATSLVRCVWSGGRAKSGGLTGLNVLDRIYGIWSQKVVATTIMSVVELYYVGMHRAVIYNASRQVDRWVHHQNLAIVATGCVIYIYIRL